MMNSSNQAFPWTFGMPGSGRASPHAGAPALRQASPLGSASYFVASLQQLVSPQPTAARPPGPQAGAGSSPTRRSSTPVPAAHSRAASAGPAVHVGAPRTPRGTGDPGRGRQPSEPPSRPVPALPSPRDSQREPGLSSARRQAGLAGLVARQQPGDVSGGLSAFATRAPSPRQMPSHESPRPDKPPTAPAAPAPRPPQQQQQGGNDSDLRHVELVRVNGPADVTNTGVGIAFCKEPGQTGPHIIYAIAQHSPAAASMRIFPGDLLHGVDGMPVYNLAPEEVTRLILGAPGSPVVLRISSGPGAVVPALISGQRPSPKNIQQPPVMPTTPPEPPPPQQAQQSAAVSRDSAGRLPLSPTVLDASNPPRRPEHQAQTPPPLPSPHSSQRPESTGVAPGGPSVGNSQGTGTSSRETQRKGGSPAVTFSLAEDGEQIMNGYQLVAAEVTDRNGGFGELQKSSPSCMSTSAFPLLSAVACLVLS